MNDLYVHQLETENKQLRIALHTTRELLDELQQRIDKAIGYTKQFINGETSRIDEWKNVELVLETIVELLGDKEQDIEFDVLKALNTDLDDDVEMG